MSELDKLTRQELLAELKHCHREQLQYANENAALKRQNAELLQDYYERDREVTKWFNQAIVNREEADRFKRRGDQLVQKLLESKAELESNREECCACSKHKEQLQAQCAAYQQLFEDALTNGFERWILDRYRSLKDGTAGTDMLRDLDKAADELICPKCANDEIYYENAKTGAGCYVCQYCEHEGTEDDFKGNDQVSILSELIAELEESDKKQMEEIRGLRGDIGLVKQAAREVIEASDDILRRADAAGVDEYELGGFECLIKELAALVKDGAGE